MTLKEAYGCNVLVNAIPDGSLNMDARGALYKVFRDARIKLIGYETGKEVDFPKCDNLEWMRFITDRPENMTELLVLGEYDTGILGWDWILTYGPEAKGIIELLDLEVGYVDIVPATDRELGIDNLDEYLHYKFKNKENILVFTEYSRLAYNLLMKNPTYRKLYRNPGTGEVMPPSVRFQGAPVNFGNNAENAGNSKERDNEKVKIINSYGRTEPKGKMGFLIVDNATTRRHIIEAGLVPFEGDIYTSSTARLFAGPHLKRDEKKREMAIDYAQRLEGVVIARNLDLIEMNVPREKLSDVVEFLKNGYCAEAPTVTPPYGNSKWGQIKTLISNNEETWETVRDVLDIQFGVRSIMRSKPGDEILASMKRKDFEVLFE